MSFALLSSFFLYQNPKTNRRILDSVVDDENAEDAYSADNRGQNLSHVVQEKVVCCFRYSWRLYKSPSLIG